MDTLLWIQVLEISHLSTVAVLSSAAVLRQRFRNY
jgi:hypothetical protein